MAVAIPLLSAVAGASAMAGVVATGVASFGTFLTIAGGMASAFGMLTKDKDLQKIGGILSLASGLVNGVQNMAQAGDATASGASAADTASTLLSEGAEGTASLLTNPGAAQGVTAPTVGSPAPMTGMDAMTGIDASGVVQAPMGGGMGSPSAGVAERLTGGGQSLFGQAQSGGPSTLLTGGATTAPRSAIEQLAAGMTQADVAAATRNAALQTQTPSLMTQVRDAASGVGRWVQQNPTMANMGFNALAGMYGPDAERMDYQRSLYERARSNLNNPVRLTYTPGG